MESEASQRRARHIAKGPRQRRREGVCRRCLGRSWTLLSEVSGDGCELAPNREQWGSVTCLKPSQYLEGSAPAPCKGSRPLNLTTSFVPYGHCASLRSLHRCAGCSKLKLRVGLLHPSTLRPSPWSLRSLWASDGRRQMGGQTPSEWG